MIRIMSKNLVVQFVFASTFLVGCVRTEKFDISVRNDTAGPLTLALTKDGPPYERTWAAPEDLAIESPRANDDQPHGFVLLPAGREADVSIEGKFDGGARGVLRVYRGDLAISDMNAIGRTSSNRLDLTLNPGANRFVIAEKQGRLVNEKHSDAAAPAP
jgi:hypothetical protein